MKKTLTLNDLHIEVEGKQIVKGVNLSIAKGEVHTLMGPNGSGKSTLSLALAGHPNYTITKGSILLNGKDISKMAPDKRSRAGLFLSFQYPNEIPGVTLAHFLRTALNARRPKDKPIPVMDFKKQLDEEMKKLDMNPSFGSRYLNQGFSGGEKKRSEILQMALLQPEYAILDETDSGLDIDALKIVAEGISSLATKERGILLITHYQRILDYITPDHVHVMINGKIMKSGGPELAQTLEKKGYGWLQE